MTLSFERRPKTGAVIPSDVALEARITELERVLGRVIIDGAPLLGPGTSPIHLSELPVPEVPTPVNLPPPPGAIATLTSSASASTFLTTAANFSYDIIELAGGSYTWQNVNLNVDRTTRPLTIRPAAGATVNFVGPASASGSLFNMTGAKWIIWDGSTGAGGTMWFKNFALAQSGVFQPFGTSHCTFKYLTFSNLSRDSAFSDQPYKSWCFYCAVGVNADMLIDHCTFAAPAVSRDISAIQIASSGSASNFSITNCSFVNYQYVLYVERPTSNLLLDTWTITNCGYTSTPSSIRLTGAVNISGTYKNIVATSSSPYLDEHTGGGTVTNGGGNSGI